MAEYIVNKYKGVYKRALELYKEDKFKDAAPLFELVVSNDLANYEAQYYLGDMLYYGKGTPKNIKRAYNLFMKAATNKVFKASYMVGLCFLEGHGTIQDYTQAVSWFTEAAKYGHDMAQYYLGLAYMKGVGVERNIPRASSWLVHAAKAGIVDAQRDAAICFEMMGNMKAAATLYLAAADNGNVYSQEKIADYYSEGVGVIKCEGLALRYYTMASEQNSVKAMVRLSKIYKLGLGTHIDLAKSLYFCNKAALMGNSDAQKALGDFYMAGEAIAKSDKVAMTWWLKSANLGNVDAMIQIAGALTDPPSKEIKRDLNEAKLWWTKASEAGSPYAMYRLGECLEKGIGTLSPNISDAYSWYRLASQNGNKEAELALSRYIRTITGKVKLKKD